MMMMMMMVILEERFKWTPLEVGEWKCDKCYGISFVVLFS